MADVTAKPLNEFWAFLEIQRDPSRLEAGKYCPSFQEGLLPWNDHSNSRCVSLTSVPGRVMEKIILGGTEIGLKNNTVMFLHVLETLGL